jgi:four helix bundle protein
MKYSRFEEIPVWQDAAALSVTVFELTSARAFRRLGDLANQIQRATLSISNNIAEGFERGTQELITFLYYARGSAGEVRSILGVAERIDALKDFRSQISDLKAKTESISRQLAGWLRSLKETQIKGERYLTERSRREDQQRKAAQQFIGDLRQKFDYSRRQSAARGDEVSSYTAVRANDEQHNNSVKRDNVGPDTSSAKR